MFLIGLAGSFTAWHRPLSLFCFGVLVVVTGGFLCRMVRVRL